VFKSNQVCQKKKKKKKKKKIHLLADTFKPPIMPLEKTAQRRSRKETLEEDLTKFIDEENINDEEVFPTLKEALNEGVDVNLIVGDRSLICYFAFYGMIRCFEECFLVGADPTIVTSKFPRDALGSAVNWFASPATSLRMVMFLLNHVKVTHSHHKEALDLACDFGRFEIVRLFLRRNNSFGDNVLWWGVRRGSIKLVEIGLEFSPDVNELLEDGRYFIHRAAELEDSSILQKLLDAGADVEAKNKTTNETPFEAAVRWNSVNCVRLLIDRECKFSYKDALLLAIRCRSHDVLKELLRIEDLCGVAKKNAIDMLFVAVAQDDLIAFRIVYPFVRFRTSIIRRLVRFEKYDMLSAALFEFGDSDLSTDDLIQLLDEAPNDDFKALLQKKIDAMNGLDLVAKVKEEAPEEEADELQSASKKKKSTKKTTTKTKSKKK